MSGLEALGTAAAIAQFVQYGIKLAKKIVELHRSSEGTSERISELERVSKDLHAFSDDLTAKASHPVTAKDDAEVGIQRLAKECQAQAESLLAVLDTLKIRGQKSISKSVRTAFKIDRHKSAIRQHEQRLDGIRKQLYAQLLKMIHADNGALAESINIIQRQNQDLEARLIQQFLSCKQELLAAVSKPSGKEDRIITLLIDVRKEGQRALQRQAIISSLRFPTMDARRQDIRDPNFTTYDWIFRSDQLATADEDVNFVSWLRQCDDLFWITGKAGSGKSTIMKFISSHPESRRHLKLWADQRELFVASYFFWNSGDSMQKSQQGLLQTILYDILRQCPELVDHIQDCSSDILPDLSLEHTNPWTFSDLRGCVEVIGDQALMADKMDVCFCLFIDGLDEYHDDHEDLVKLILLLNESRNIKLCVSSRPWEVYVDAFQASVKSHHWLRLHLHTRRDIAAVAHQELGPLAQNRQHDRAEVELLVQELANKAEGVFLWVTLVIKELIKGFRHADTLGSLRDRLEKIPPGLDEYYDHILSSIDEFYRQESARIFSCCLLANLEWLPAQAFSYLARQEPHIIPAGRQISYSDWNSASALEQIRKQLNGRCLDLLQLVPSSSPERPFPTVKFLHRTVQEFLKNEDVSIALRKRSGMGYSPPEVLCSVHLLLLNTTFGRVTPTWKIQWANHIIEHAQRLEFSNGQTALHLLSEMVEYLSSSFNSNSWHNRIDGVFRFNPYDTKYNTFGFLLCSGLVQNAIELYQAKPYDNRKVGAYTDTLVLCGILSRMLKDPSIVEINRLGQMNPAVRSNPRKFFLMHFANKELLDSLLDCLKARFSHQNDYPQMVFDVFRDTVLRNVTKDIERDLRNLFRDLTWTFFREDRRYTYTVREDYEQNFKVLSEAFGPAEAIEMLDSGHIRLIVPENTRRRWYKLW